MARNPVSGNVLTNDSDPDGDTLTVVRVNGVHGNVGQTVAGTYGTLLLRANGTYDYTLNNALPAVNNLNNGQTLTDSFSYESSDGQIADAATLQVTIRGNTDNRAPVAVNDARSITEDGTNPVSGNVLTNDTDADGDSLAVSRVEGVVGNVGTTINGTYGTIRINSNGTYQYTLNNSHPAVNGLNAGQSLTESFDYTVTDGTASDIGGLTITINGNTDNRAPVAVNDARSITEDGTNPVTGNVLSNDTDADGDSLTVSRVEGVAGNVGTTINGTYGTIRINAPGTYQYTLNNSHPAVNALNDGQTLTESFDYTVTDGTAGSNGRLTITINGSTDVVNTPPTAVADTNSVTEDSANNPVMGNVLSNDSDADGDTLTVDQVNGLASNVGNGVTGNYGTLVLRSNGSYDYTLDNSNATVNALASGQTLTENFLYRITDSQATDSSSLTLTIRGADDNGTPVAVADSNSITEDSNTNPVSGNVLTNDTDPDGDTLTVVRVNGVAANVGQSVAGTYGTLLLRANGTYDYTLDNSNPVVNALNNGATITENFGYSITDSQFVTSSTLAIVIRGNTDNRAPMAVADIDSIFEDGTNPVSGNVLTNDSDPDGDTLTVVRVNGIHGNVGQSVAGTYGSLLLRADGSYDYTLDNANPAVNALDNGRDADRHLRLPELGQPAAGILLLAGDDSWQHRQSRSGGRCRYQLHY